MLGWRPLFTLDEGLRAHDRLVPRASWSAPRERDATLPLVRRRRPRAGALARQTPLANALLDADELDEPEPTFPLELAFCPACSLVQITETVPPEMLFRDYVYFSSFSDTMLRHARELADAARRASASSGREPGRRGREQRRLPAAALRGARACRCSASSRRGTSPRSREERGVRTIARVLRRGSLAQRLAGEGRRADVFHANNVLAHVADLNGFVAGIATRCSKTTASR